MGCVLRAVTRARASVSFAKLIAEVVAFPTEQGLSAVEQLADLQPEDIVWPDETIAGKKSFLRTACKHIRVAVSARGLKTRSVESRSTGSVDSVDVAGMDQRCSVYAMWRKI